MSAEWMMSGLVIVLITIFAAWGGILFRKAMFAQKPSWSSRFRTSFVTGGLASLAFICLTLTIGYFDREYVWSAKNLVGIGIVSFIVGLLTAVGTYWHLLIIGWYQNYLYRKLGKDRKNE